MVSIFESIRNIQAAKNVQDVVSNSTPSKAVASKEPEFVRMKTYGIAIVHNHMNAAIPMDVDTHTS